mmetsp:Transcript_37354/g.81612  ORF Transcript_37354/g.81612 Transcript_37354/m.81612 type:complete len:200 (-) Transcript_37354:607-1206(-)
MAVENRHSRMATCDNRSHSVHIHLLMGVQHEHLCERQHSFGRCHMREAHNTTHDFHFVPVRRVQTERTTLDIPTLQADESLGNTGPMRVQPKAVTIWCFRKIKHPGSKPRRLCRQPSRRREDNYTPINKWMRCLCLNEPVVNRVVFRNNVLKFLPGFPMNIHNCAQLLEFVSAFVFFAKPQVQKLGNGHRQWTQNNLHK